LIGKRRAQDSGKRQGLAMWPYSVSLQAALKLIGERTRPEKSLFVSEGSVLAAVFYF
jgi:hypothetical protein